MVKYVLLKCLLLNIYMTSRDIMMFFFCLKVSITLIATGFKRQEEGEGRAVQMAQTDAASVGATRRPSSSFRESGSVEIPEFLKKKGSSRYPRV